MFNVYYILCANLAPSGALTYDLEAKLKAVEMERQAEIEALNKRDGDFDGFV